MQLYAYKTILEFINIVYTLGDRNYRIFRGTLNFYKPSSAYLYPQVREKHDNHEFKTCTYPHI